MAAKLSFCRAQVAFAVWADQFKLLRFRRREAACHQCKTKKQHYRFMTRREDHGLSLVSLPSVVKSFQFRSARPSNSDLFQYEYALSN